MEISDHPSLDGVKKIPRVVPKIHSTNFSGPQKKIPKKRGLKIILAIIILTVIILGGFVLARAANLTGKIFVGQKSSFYNQLGDLLKSQFGGVKLLGEDSGQINILLLGIGGQGHDGPYLTDTMILAQIRPADNKVSLISIPRDYQVDYGGGYFGKINGVFTPSFLKAKNWNDGGKAATKAVGYMAQEDIPYFAVLDFSGFEKAIDLVGGVDIQIDRTFTDYSYPDSGDGYLPPVTFKAGTEHMGGSRALIFARSRHAAGPEGSDFARSQRQQKIINAFKKKVLQLNLVTDLSNLNNLLSVIGDHAHTNLTPGEMLHLYNITKDYTGDNITSLNLDPTTGIICPQILESNGAYILALCPGKKQADLTNFFSNSFTIGKLAGEKSIVWMADSTKSQTLYNKAEKLLLAAGVTVYKVAYSGGPIDQTLVYEANPKPATKEFIKNNLSATEVSLPPPGMKVNKDKVDLVIILGGSTIPNLDSSKKTPNIQTETLKTKLPAKGI